LGDDGGEAGGEEGLGAEGSVPVTHNGGGDEEGVVVGRVPSTSLNGDSDVAGGAGVVTNANLSTDKVGSLLLLCRAELDRVGGGREGTEVGLGELDEGGVLDTSGSDENHAVGGVVLLDVGGEVVAGDGKDVLLGAEDGAAEGLTCKKGRRGRVRNGFSRRKI
jgi:hypothetical protein